MHINVEKPRLSGKNKVNLRHNLFVDYYLADPDKNATKAYLKVYPNCSYNTANSNSSQLLAKTSIKELIAQKEAEILKKSEENVILSRNQLLQQIQTDRIDAKNDKQHSVAMKGNELYAKINGYIIDRQVTLNTSLEDLIANINKNRAEHIDTQEEKD